MGTFREVAEEGGSGTDSLRKVLPSCGLGGAPLWGGNLYFDGNDAEKLEGLHVGFLWQEAGMTARNLAVDTWQKERVEMVLQATGTNPIR